MDSEERKSCVRHHTAGAESRSRSPLLDMNNEEQLPCGPLTNFHVNNVHLNFVERCILQSDSDSFDQTLPSSPLPQESDHVCDDFAAQELWQEVREFCDYIDHDDEEGEEEEEEEPLPMARPSLREFLATSNIKIQNDNMPYTTPAKHFSMLDTQLILPSLTENIDLSAMKDELIARATSCFGPAFAHQVLEDVYHPIMSTTKTVYKVPNALLSLDALRSENTSRLPVKQLKENVSQPNAIVTKPSIRGSAIPRAATALRIATQVPKNPRPGNTGQPSLRTMQTQQTERTHPTPNALIQPLPLGLSIGDLLTGMLFGHDTFWLRLPFPRSSSIPGVRVSIGASLAAFPYLTILKAGKSWDPNDVEAIAALISSSILSAQVKELQECQELKKTDYDAELCHNLRHYTIVLNSMSYFTVYMTELTHGASAGYLISTLFHGPVFTNRGTFEMWLRGIHGWATKTWKPMMITAFFSEDFVSDLEVGDDVGEDAQHVKEEWAGVENI
ncbi:hypothetical protein AYL99_00625 [Fonsecaea erecta]|uniref:Uncharacterized protein n=1 Tax=Fonsecaea erecta TaxID=1367422 RepID=A0A178ZZQ0_9EURO|nr:hypothetical protein AYL99_00625 [Fonsecaea erecta]OAP64653.1 hypothetical protein AYL99_00625 [Fonsecaea erecta]